MKLRKRYRMAVFEEGHHDFGTAEVFYADKNIVDTLRSEQEQVVRIVTESMEHAADLRVRLLVDYGIGNNWLEAH